MLPGSGTHTPGSASRSKRKDKSKKRDEMDEALERHAAQGHELDEELDDDDDLYHDAATFDYPTEGPTDFKYHNRSYDDEDEALQAALKASMADLPPGFEMPELKPLKAAPVKKSTQPAPAQSSSASASRQRTEPARAAPEPPRWRPAEEPPQNAPPDTVTEEDDDEPVQELTPGKLIWCYPQLTYQRRSVKRVLLDSSSSSRSARSKRQGRTVPRSSDRGAGVIRCRIARLA